MGRLELESVTKKFNSFLALEMSVLKSRTGSSYVCSAQADAGKQLSFVLQQDLRRRSGVICSLTGKNRRGE